MHLIVLLVAFLSFSPALARTRILCVNVVHTTIDDVFKKREIVAENTYRPFKNKPVLQYAHDRCASRAQNYAKSPVNYLFWILIDEAELDHLTDLVTHADGTQMYYRAATPKKGTIDTIRIEGWHTFENGEDKGLTTWQDWYTRNMQSSSKPESEQEEQDAHRGRSRSRRRVRRRKTSTEKQAHAHAKPRPRGQSEGNIGSRPTTRHRGPVAVRKPDVKTEYVWKARRKDFCCNVMKT